MIHQNVIQKEAREILDFFTKEWGQQPLGDGTHQPAYEVNGIEAVKWIKEKDFRTWREMSWAGYFITHKTQKFFDENEDSNLKSCNDISQKKYRLKGKAFWDIRFHNIDASRQEDLDWIPLGDIFGFYQDAKKYDGIGLIILHANVIMDDDWTFYEAHEDLKYQGGQSSYQEKRRIEGIRIRKRKKSFRPLLAISTFLTLDDLLNSQNLPWLVGNFQESMRNSDDKSRNKKFAIDLNKLPSEKIIEIERLNVSDEEWEYMIKNIFPNYKKEGQNNYIL